MLADRIVLDGRRSAVRVLAPDAMHLDARCMVALGLGRTPTLRRGEQLDRCRHIVAIRDERPVGFAAFELTDDRDLLVHELSSAADDDAAISALVSALELACLAAGGTHLLMSARIAAPAKKLESYGYVQAAWTGWMEKCVL